MYKADRRIYVTADRSEVVEESDPRAAILLAAEGQEITDAEAKRLGLVGKKAAEPDPVVVQSSAADPEPPADEEATRAKAVAGPPETKAQAAPKADKK